ncbi:28.2 kDa [Spodoptera frugiperda ascovirus 1a]|uniref:Uncharacterized protein ORF12 n=1 Tax=Spodoptera frugiperda ascovirus 1a TaxID=113370 RepID=Y012_SFAVA|nr:28.2 kDa [Spodoptera frugiperda ascovirus 1a]Q0E589.1 RecName: Full=Uncharacterized protein ORF12 [Spodoptera frugiperda ascovirus 1a]CAL44612.1 28.2 kDa [Spodoptera frugiperda ascovirus 1a]
MMSSVTSEIIHTDVSGQRVRPPLTYCNGELGLKNSEDAAYFCLEKFKSFNEVPDFQYIYLTLSLHVPPPTRKYLLKFHKRLLNVCRLCGETGDLVGGRVLVSGVSQKTADIVVSAKSNGEVLYDWSNFFKSTVRVRCRYTIAKLYNNKAAMREIAKQKNWQTTYPNLEAYRKLNDAAKNSKHTPIVSIQTPPPPAPTPNRPDVPASKNVVITQRYQKPVEKIEDSRLETTRISVIPLLSVLLLVIIIILL